MTKRRRRSQLCIYCGIRPGTTLDHVPPKGIFPRPRPNDLVTVPCCQSCRRAQSADDEYFRNMVTLRLDVAALPAVRDVLDAVHRALSRPEQRRLTTGLVRSLRDVELRTVAGLYLGRAKTYTADIKRLDNVIRRTMLGLYFHETGQRLPTECVATVFCVEGFAEANFDVQSAVVRLVDQAVMGKRRTFGDDVFSYWAQGFEEPHATLWLFALHRRVLFIGFTETPQKRNEGADGSNS